ncbi:hypothetical protein [Dietzia sp. B32]|uniref:hypothetical protein n=1 Tax=Dietzia sp. B32 TaxID=2915130 RepID=UPI0021AD697C|nr:hypothetical protein [Dietzia sp. B32]UVE96589.1 hypothetical protein L8M95_07450 [Dietzia sp. B32]
MYPTANPPLGHRATSATPTCPFAERFGRRLPRGFAAEAAGLDWRTLVDTYAPSSDHFHLADLSRRPLGRGITAYEAILATRAPGDAPGEFTAHRLTTESCGDLTAMSDMLGRVGARTEIERFHQYEGHRYGDHSFGDTESWCTILRAGCGRRETWALGFGQTSSEASIAALLSAATRLHLR